MVGQDTFKKLFDIADRKLTVKHPTTYSHMVTDTAQNTLSKVCQIIAREKTEIVSVGVTTDLWTSRAGDSYISLTLSWVDQKFRLLRFTPFVHPFPGRHTGDRISIELDEMLRDLQFDPATDKVCVSDNASNMKVALRHSEQLREYYCNIHTLQLGIEDTFKNVHGMTGVLSKAKNIAKFCHQSTVAMDELRDAAKKLKIEFRKPKNPNKTRWDSQYETMKSVLHLRSAIEDLENRKPEWEAKSLNRSEWKLMEGAVKLLEIFKETTKVWQYEAIPTMNYVVERVYTMEENLAAFLADRNNDKHGLTFARTLLTNLEKRFPNHGLTIFEHRAANYIDPHFKGIHLRKFRMFDSTKDDIERKIAAEVAAEEDTSSIHSDDEANNNVESEPSVESMSPTSKLRYELKALENESTEDSKIKQEMSVFERLDVAGKEESVLGWWKAQAKTLPILAKFARRILGVPVSSGKSERVFSTGGNFVKEKRTRLNAKKVESLIIIKENRRQVGLYGGDNLEPVAGDKAFEKIKVVTNVGLPDDQEDSSGNEYYMDED